MGDIIACLYPLGRSDGYAARAVRDPQNSSRLISAEKQGTLDLPGRGSRESTAPLDEIKDTTKETPRGDGLQLTFTHRPKVGTGFAFGTDRNRCDIVLPSLPHLSRCHCYLTFDAERRLIVRDCSTNGTSVEYDGKGRGKRSHFTWIIGGLEVPNHARKIFIEIDEELMFQVIVAKPSCQDTYLEKVDNFLQENVASASLHFGALGIQSNASTAAPSGTHTRNQDPILLEQETLGKGGFAKVSRVWDVSTGFVHASKQFFLEQSGKSSWRQEASIMGQISHEHLVKLYSVIEQPTPQLILEYVPLGNLKEQHYRKCLSKNDIISTLLQGLSALSYLHEQTPPIVHRDIKPENILVQARDPIYIKLADFGLSKASDDLKTLCGTYTYLAPEVSKYDLSEPRSDIRYTRAVDIWSFGVVIFQFLYDLPDPGSGAGLRWCKRIVDKLNDCDSDGLVDLLSNMIAMEPQRRYSAEECLENASRLDSSSRSSIPKLHPDGSFQPQAPQAGSSSPTVKFSSCEFDKLRHNQPKRQRSPGENSNEIRRNTKPFLHEPSVSRMASMVLKRLTDIHSGDGDLGIPDSRTTLLVNILCKHCKRLKIAELKIDADEATDCTVVTAVSGTHEFTLAKFTSSDCARSVADLAQDFNEILQRMTPGTTHSPNFDVTQPSPQDNQDPEETKSIKAIECTSAGHGTRSPIVTARERDTIHSDISNREHISGRTDSTISCSELPVTYPSTEWWE